MIQFFMNQKPLHCEYCGQNVFEIPKTSLVCSILDVENNTIIDVYVACKGKCDKILRKVKLKHNCIDRWVEISELINPLLYLRMISRCMYDWQAGIRITEEAFKKYLTILMLAAPYVMRKPTDNEIEHADMLIGLP